MPQSTELSIATVVALVLGGVAAVVLAGAVAGKEPNRVKRSAASAPAGATTRTARGAVTAPSAEVEIPAELLYPVEAPVPSGAEP